MKIQDVNTRETADTITIFAKCKIRRVGYDEAYFTFDKKYKRFLQVDASPFAAALLIPSMKQGEDLIIDGSISKELYDGMHEIMRIVSTWGLGLKPIKIQATNIIANPSRPTTTATFFSGGVDSFYTYLKHKHDSKDPITHLLLVNGYDIDPRNKNLWAATLHNIQHIAAAEQVKLIEVETNIRSLIDPILAWDYTHGGCLAAVGLCLRKGLKKVYVPSSYTAEQQFPWGSHLDLDHHWSTETLAFVHDGSEASRVNKVAWQIAKSPSALKHLRVCYMNEKGAYNCGVCDKCLRTMTNLYLAGSLDKAATFPHVIDTDLVARLPIEGKHGAIFHEENLAGLRERNMFPELQDALRTGLENVQETSASMKKISVSRIICMDHIYLRGSLFSIAQTVLGRRF